MKCEYNPKLTCYKKKACEYCVITIGGEKYTQEEWAYYNKNFKFISNPFNWNKPFPKRD